MYSSFTIVFLMLLQIGQTYWWKGLNRDVDQYCRRCDVCQPVNAAKLEGKKAELHPIPVPSKVWSQIGIDLIGMYISQVNKKENFLSELRWCIGFLGNDCVKGKETRV